MRPHNRIDPASADHIPVMEYSSGVTVLLFWATNTSVKSCVTRACSMAPSRRGRPRAHGRQQPGVGPRSAAAGAGAPAPRRRAAGGGPARRCSRRCRRGRPRRRARCRWSPGWRRASAGRAGRRRLHPVRVLGGVGARVLDQDGVRDEVVEVSDVKWPTTTTGNPALNRLGGLPVLATCTTCGALADVEVRAGRRWRGWCPGPPSPRGGRSACPASADARRPGRPCRSS